MSPLFRIPWPDSRHEYSLQDIEVESFSEPQYLRGNLAEFFIQPELLFDQGRMAQPGTPSGRFVRTESGSFVALDTTSIQVVTVYAHLERLRKLDVATGSAEFLPLRQTVGINVGIINAEKQIVENNAQYNPSVDSLLFVPYSESDLPIVFNAGVIAHEHFHSIFHKMVLSGFQTRKAYLSESIDEPVKIPPLTDPPKADPPQTIKDPPIPTISVDQYNRFVLRGINEGLADYWGWLYSGDESFVGRSLPNAIELRRLDKNIIQFFNLDYFRTKLSEDVDDRVRLSRSYALGSQYAVYFHSLSLSLFNGSTDEQMRTKMARILILALPDFKRALEAKIDNEYLAPEIFVRIFVKAIQKYSDAPNLKNFEACKSLKTVVPLAVEKCADSRSHEN